MWKVELSDGHIVEQSKEIDITLWRKTMHRCKEHGLHVVSFTWNGEEVDDRAVACFVINDAVGSSAHGLVRLRFGLGIFRENGKGRIHWKTVIGNPKHGDYSEVVKPKDAETYRELAVDKKT
jgi:hypothetical protein